MISRHVLAWERRGLILYTGNTIHICHFNVCVCHLLLSEWECVCEWVSEFLCLLCWYRQASIVTLGSMRSPARQSRIMTSTHTRIPTVRMCYPESEWGRSVKHHSIHFFFVSPISKTWTSISTQTPIKQEKTQIRRKHSRPPNTRPFGITLIFWQILCSGRYIGNRFSKHNFFFLTCLSTRLFFAVVDVSFLICYHPLLFVVRWSEWMFDPFRDANFVLCFNFKFRVFFFVPVPYPAIHTSCALYQCFDLIYEANILASNESIGP